MSSYHTKQEEGSDLGGADDSSLTVAAAEAAAAAAAAAAGAVEEEAAAAAVIVAATAVYDNNDNDNDSNNDNKNCAAPVDYSKWNKNGFGAPVAKQSGKFSKEESELVRKSVEEFCAAKQISTARLCSECDHKAELKGAWMEIAKRIPHRSVQSVYRHGIRRLHPFKRGAWTDAEVTMLVELVARLGKKWSTIQGKLNRSADSCRDKYREMSDDYIKGRWKEQETELLKRLIREQVGVSDDTIDMKMVAKLVEDKNIQLPWSSISKRMGKRSRLSCFKKWQKLTGVLPDEDALFRPTTTTTTTTAGGKRKAADDDEDDNNNDEEDDEKDNDSSVGGGGGVNHNNIKRVKTETADFDDYDPAKMADETVAAVGLPDARASFVS